MNKENKKGALNDAEGYDRIAREVFLPVFPMIAGKALQVYGRTDGLCLDIGSGGGLFGYNIALLSDMRVNFLDIQENAMNICIKRGREWGLLSRSAYTVGDVHAIPLPSDTFSLIVSRGSIKFWGEDDELKQAFREIYRVLAPGGTTLIGSSLGTPEMQAAIEKKMQSYNPEWVKERKAGTPCFRYESRKKLLDELGIPCRIESDEAGTWFVMSK